MYRRDTLFFISVISFFIFAISDIQLLLGGYLFAGIPALFISGAIPSFATFSNKLRPQYVNQDETHTGSSDSDNVMKVLVATIIVTVEVVLIMENFVADG